MAKLQSIDPESAGQEWKRRVRGLGLIGQPTEDIRNQQGKKWVRFDGQGNLIADYQLDYLYVSRTKVH